MVVVAILESIYSGILFYFICVNTAHLLCFCGAAAKIQMVPCFKDTKIIEAFLVNYLGVV